MGLTKTLWDRKERHSRVAKHGVSEEVREQINETLRKVEKGSKVCLANSSRA